MRGRDSIGRFELRVTKRALQTCDACGARIHATLQYEPDDAKNAVEDGVSLLRFSGGSAPTLGIACGCYAKVCRQIAHIRDGR